jgi:DNA-binding NarL/FixJ family response regulator
MDINLPGMTGLQCVKKLKEKMPKLQCMMLAVYENSERIFAALSAGACGYLLKSTPPQRLLEKLHVNSRTEAVVKYLDASNLNSRVNVRS